MRRTEEILWALSGDDWESPAARAAELAFNFESEPGFVSILLTDGIYLEWSGSVKSTAMLSSDGHYYLTREVAE